MYFWVLVVFNPFTLRIPITRGCESDGGFGADSKVDGDARSKPGTSDTYVRDLGIVAVVLL